MEQTEHLTDISTELKLFAYMQSMQTPYLVE